MTEVSLPVGAGSTAHQAAQTLASSEQTQPISLRWTRRDWAVLVGLALLVILFHWRLLTPNPADRQSYGSGDFVHQFWAFSTFEARELSAGRLPLWNPYTYAGSPFWADVQSAVFYPFSLLTLLLSGMTRPGFSLFALELEAVFHFWLGGLFMYLLARRVTQSRGAGWVAALIFTFGGYLTGYPSQQLAVLEVDVWLPLILFFIDRALLDRRPKQPSLARLKPHLPDLLLAGAAWGLAVLAGHPQSWLIVGYTLVAYYLFTMGWERGRGKGKAENRKQKTRYVIGKIAGLILLLSTGLALAAIQLLPAIEYTRLSVRAEGLYDTMAGGLPLTDPLQLLLPGVVSYYSPLYVGVAGLLLAILGLVYDRDRWIVFWGIWSGLALLVGFGGETFLYGPLYLVAPGFSIFRGQERWLFAFAFGLALLAGYGFAALLRLTQAQADRLAGFRRFIGWLLMGAIGLVFLFFFGLNQTGWADNQFYRLLNSAVLLTILLTLAVKAFRIACHQQMRQSIVLWAFSGLIIFDLFSVNWQNNLDHHLPEWHTQEPAIVAALEADGLDNDQPFRVHNEFRLYDNYGVPFALQDLWGASPLRLAAYDRFLQPPMLIERAWWLLNVRYVITWRSELFVPSTILYQEPAANGVTYLHRLDEVGPRAWIAHQVEHLPEEAMLDRLAAADFDFRQVALLPPEVELPPLSTSDTDRVEVLSAEPNRLELAVEAGADGLLVISEVDYPGWQAAIDGEPIPLLRADTILRALPVSAGRHEVILTFRPPSFRIGAILSAVTLVGLLFFIVRYGLRRE